MINRYAFASLYILTVSLVLSVWLKSVGNPLAYIVSGYPPGQGYYIFSKLMGLVSLIVFGIQGLTGVYRPFFNKIFPQKAHQYLGVAVFTAMLLHVAGFLTATTIRSGYFTGHLLLPDVDDFYHARITVGVGALLLTTIAVSSRAIRIEPLAKYLHWLTIPAVYLASWHALAIGTETRTPLIQTLIFIILVALSIGLLNNVYKGLSRKKRVSDKCIS